MELNLPQARILIIKMSSLGDIICALPALFALRKKYPHAHITWAVHHAFKDILPGTSYLDDKVVIDRNRLRQNYIGNYANARLTWYWICRCLLRVLWWRG